MRYSAFDGGSRFEQRSLETANTAGQPLSIPTTPTHHPLPPPLAVAILRRNSIEYRAAGSSSSLHRNFKSFPLSPSSTVSGIMNTTDFSRPQNQGKKQRSYDARTYEGEPIRKGASSAGGKEFLEAAVSRESCCNAGNWN